MFWRNILADKTKIEWSDATLNLVWGCDKVSTGCDNCYAERLSKLFNMSFKIHELKFENKVKDLDSWKTGKRIFVNSMSDTFHESLTDFTIDKWFDLFRKYERHTFIILTKRINRAFNYFMTRQVPSNCWIGTSVENKAALHRIEKLKMIKSYIRFVSFEPLLEDVTPVDLKGIHWAIVGGESDYKNPRPMKPDWAWNIYQECQKYGTAFFYKQEGGKQKDADDHWGTNKLFGKEYMEYPNLLAQSIEQNTYLQKT